MIEKWLDSALCIHTNGQALIAFYVSIFLIPILQLIFLRPKPKVQNISEESLKILECLVRILQIESKFGSEKERLCRELSNSIEKDLRS